MKALKILIAGALLWALSLVWPDVNRWLTLQTMLVAVAGLGTVTAGYYWLVHRREMTTVEKQPFRTNYRPPDVADTRPLKPLGTI